MAKKDFVEQKTEELIMPIIEGQGFELYDIEYVKEGSTKYLRVFIDSAEGISVNDCEAVSRAFNDVLDREDYIDEAYIFEVSSPGLGRALKKDKHLAKSIGEEVEIKLFKALNKKKEYNGILKAFDDQTITINLIDDEGEETEPMTIERSLIALVRLALYF